jgi:hypothetical protein
MMARTPAVLTYILEMPALNNGQDISCPYILEMLALNDG